MAGDEAVPRALAHQVVPPVVGVAEARPARQHLGGLAPRRVVLAAGHRAVRLGHRHQVAGRVVLPGHREAQGRSVRPGAGSGLGQRQVARAVGVPGPPAVRLDAGRQVAPVVVDQPHRRLGGPRGPGRQPPLDQPVQVVVAVFEREVQPRVGAARPPRVGHGDLPVLFVVGEGGAVAQRVPLLGRLVPRRVGHPRLAPQGVDGAHHVAGRVVVLPRHRLVGLPVVVRVDDGRRDHPPQAVHREGDGVLAPHGGGVFPRLVPRQVVGDPRPGPGPVGLLRVAELRFRLPLAHRQAQLVVLGGRDVAVVVHHRGAVAQPVVEVAGLLHHLPVEAQAQLLQQPVLHVVVFPGPVAALVGDLLQVGEVVVVVGAGRPDAVLFREGLLLQPLQGVVLVVRGAAVRVGDGRHVPPGVVGQGGDDAPRRAGEGVSLLVEAVVLLDCHQPAQRVEVVHRRPALRVGHRGGVGRVVVDDGGGRVVGARRVAARRRGPPESVAVVRQADQGLAPQPVVAVLAGVAPPVGGPGRQPRVTVVAGRGPQVGRRPVRVPHLLLRAGDGVVAAQARVVVVEAGQVPFRAAHRLHLAPLPVGVIGGAGDRPVAADPHRPGRLPAPLVVAEVGIAVAVGRLVARVGDRVADRLAQQPVVDLQVLVDGRGAERVLRPGDPDGGTRAGAGVVAPGGRGEDPLVRLEGDRLPGDVPPVVVVVGGPHGLGPAALVDLLGGAQGAPVVGREPRLQQGAAGLVEHVDPGVDRDVHGIIGVFRERAAQEVRERVAPVDPPAARIPDHLVFVDFLQAPIGDDGLPAVELPLPGVLEVVVVAAGDGGRRFVPGADVAGDHRLLSHADVHLYGGREQAQEVVPSLGDEVLQGFPVVLERVAADAGPAGPVHDEHPLGLHAGVDLHGLQPELSGHLAEHAPGEDVPDQGDDVDLDAVGGGEQELVVVAVLPGPPSDVDGLFQQRQGGAQQRRVHGVVLVAHLPSLRIVLDPDAVDLGHHRLENIGVREADPAPQAVLHVVERQPVVAEGLPVVAVRGDDLGDPPQAVEQVRRAVPGPQPGRVQDPAEGVRGVAGQQPQRHGAAYLGDVEGEVLAFVVLENQVPGRPERDRGAVLGVRALVHLGDVVEASVRQPQHHRAVRPAHVGQVQPPPLPRAVGVVAVVLEVLQRRVGDGGQRPLAGHRCQIDGVGVGEVADPDGQVQVQPRRVPPGGRGVVDPPQLEVEAVSARQHELGHRGHRRAPLGGDGDRLVRRPALERGELHVLQLLRAAVLDHRRLDGELAEVVGGEEDLVVRGVDHAVGHPQPAGPHRIEEVDAEVLLGEVFGHPGLVVAEQADVVLLELGVPLPFLSLLHQREAENGADDRVGGKRLHRLALDLRDLHGRRFLRQAAAADEEVDPGVLDLRALLGGVRGFRHAHRGGGQAPQADVARPVDGLDVEGRLRAVGQPAHPAFEVQLARLLPASGLALAAGHLDLLRPGQVGPPDPVGHGLPVVLVPAQQHLAVPGHRPEGAGRVRRDRVDVHRGPGFAEVAQPVDGPHPDEVAPVLQVRQPVRADLPHEGAAGDRDLVVVHPAAVIPGGEGDHGPGVVGPAGRLGLHRVRLRRDRVHVQPERGRGGGVPRPVAGRTRISFRPSCSGRRTLNPSPLICACWPLTKTATPFASRASPLTTTDFVPCQLSPAGAMAPITGGSRSRSTVIVFWTVRPPAPQASIRIGLAAWSRGTGARLAKEAPERRASLPLISTRAGRSLTMDPQTSTALAVRQAPSSGPATRISIGPA